MLPEQGPGSQKHCFYDSLLFKQCDKENIYQGIKSFPPILLPEKSLRKLTQAQFLDLGYWTVCELVFLNDENLDYQHQLCQILV